MFVGRPRIFGPNDLSPVFRIEKQDIRIPGPDERPGIFYAPGRAMIKGEGEGADNVRVGVYGASAFNNGVVGECKDNDVAGVLGLNDYPRGIGISGLAEKGIGVYGEGGQLAGRFVGNVEITGDLSLQGVSVRLLLDRLQQLEQKVLQLEKGIIDLPGRYQMFLTPSSLHLAKPNGAGEIVVNAQNLSAEQRELLLRKTRELVVEFFRVNTDRINNDKITATDIGGFVYGAAASVVLELFSPLKAYEYLAKLASKALPVDITFTNAAVQNGRFYGAIVDDFLAVLRGVDQPALTSIVGTLATLYYTEVTGMGAVTRIFGTDGWSLIKKVGAEVGGGLAEAVSAIESAIGVARDLAGGAGEFVKEVFGNIFG